MFDENRKSMIERTVSKEAQEVSLEEGMKSQNDGAGESLALSSPPPTTQMARSIFKIPLYQKI